MLYLMQPGGLCTFGGGDMGIKLTDTYLVWNPTTVIPDVGKIVIMESYSGYTELLYVDEPIDEWGVHVAKWAYLPIEETKEEDTLDGKIQEVEDEIERFKCAICSHTVAVDKFSDQLRQFIHQYTEGDPDKCRCRSYNDNIKTSGDDTPESSVSGPEGEVSIDELGKIFSRLMQNKRFREAYINEFNELYEKSIGEDEE